METLSRRFSAWGFAGTLVEHFLIGGELLVGDQGKVGAFGQVMADATVLAFAGPAVPGAVGMAKKDRGDWAPSRHRLTQKERLLFEAAKKHGFLKTPANGIRSNVIDVYRLWCVAEGRNFIIKSGSTR